MERREDLVWSTDSFFYDQKVFSFETGLKEPKFSSCLLKWGKLKELLTIESSLVIALRAFPR